MKTMEKKFILTDEFVINVFGVKLFRIKCVKSFKYAKEGELGGFIEKEGNLEQFGDAWVSDNARVYDNARVSDNALVSDNARVYGDALVYGDARVSDNARVYGDAWVSDNARVYGDAQVYGDARVSDNALVSDNARVYGNARVSGDAQVYRDAKIGNNDSHCGFDCFGSANRHTHAYLTKDNKVKITCGCFKGSIEEFEKKVEETHSGTVYEKQYKAIIDVIKIKFGL